MVVLVKPILRVKKEAGAGDIILILNPRIGGPTLLPSHLIHLHNSTFFKSLILLPRPRPRHKKHC